MIVAGLPKYTLVEAQAVKRSLVSIIEFAFFTALTDLTDDDKEVHVGPVDGGGMQPHRGRHELVLALVERLLQDDELVLYPAPKSDGSES